MTTQQIGYFLKLAEELNYTKVAQSFFITQPTLSKQIVNLENELKVTLFTRDHNSVRLTEAGKRFYERMKPIFLDLMDAIRETQSYDENRESLTIGIQEEQLISNPLALAINDLRSEYPELNVSIHRANIDELTEGLENGKYDLINALENLLVKPDEHYKNLVQSLILEEESYYLAHSKILLELPDEITKDRLSDVITHYDLIFPSFRDTVSNEQARDFFIESMPDIKADKIKIRVIQSGRPISLPTQVSSQLGVSLCNKTSLFSVDPEIKLSKIIDTEGAYQKGILCRKGTTNPYVKALFELVKKQKEKIR